MHRRRRNASHPAVAVAAMFALSATSVVALLQAASVATAVTTPTTTSTQSPAVEPREKLTASVRQQLRQDDAADFWIDLDAEADLSAAKDIADWDERGQYVYDTLTSTARQSQAGLIKELEAADTAYESFWIDNRILVTKGDLDLALDLARETEVASITETTRLDPVEPVFSGTIQNVAQGVEWNLDQINAPEAWELGGDGAGITVSSIDSGVQWDHPALRAQYRGLQADGAVEDDYNWFDASSRCAGEHPCDEGGHGTHTMGTMVGDDGAGNQIGVAPEAQWIHANGCDRCYDSDLLASGQWILAPTRADGSGADPAKRPHVVNNSWGSSLRGQIDDWYDATTEAWEAAGIFGTWSSGNLGPECVTTSSPGANTGTYSVGAVDSAGQIAPFSSRGPGQDGLTKPNITAPGVAIRSSLPGGEYAPRSGTSMAAPHVAGAVAALWSYNSGLIGDIVETRRLLNESAAAADDITCGGTIGNNNVYGSGTLDVERLLQLAPEEKGTVAGTVTSGGAPVAGATVVFDGPTTRTVTTDADGAFSELVTVGDYTLTGSAFGYRTRSATATVSADETTTVDLGLVAVSRHAVTGTVNTSTTGEPAAGLTLTLQPGNVTTTSAADGTYEFTDVPAGTYTLSTSGTRCIAGGNSELVVDEDETNPVIVAYQHDASGYYCAEGTAEPRTGETALGFGNFDKFKEVTLPFAFEFYGTEFQTAYVSRTGELNFLQPAEAVFNSRLPNRVRPNAAIYPFWDTVIRSGGDAYTVTTTIDGVNAFVIEYRDHGAADEPLNFSVTLFEDGRVEFIYADLAESEKGRGGGATVGIENSLGTVGSQYSYNTPSLYEGLSIVYQVAPRGMLSGVVKDANTQDGLAGATVTATPRHGGTPQTVRAGQDGRYTLDLIAAGAYDLDFSAHAYRPVADRVSITAGADAVRDAQLQAPRLGFSRTEIAADLELGGEQATAIEVTNTGTAPTGVDLGVADAEFVMLGDDGAGPGVAADGTWLDVQPSSFTLQPGQAVTAVVTLDAGVDQPGTYTADIVVGNDTPYVENPVATTLTVGAPEGWGRITGTVTGDGSPLADAVVHLDGIFYDVTLDTTADGTYTYWLQQANAPVRLIVSADGYRPTNRTAQVVRGQTTRYDFDLEAL